MENLNCFESIYNKQSNFFNVDFFSTSTESSSKSSSESLTKPFIGEIDLHIFLINVKTHQGSMTYQYLLNTYSPQEINKLLFQISPFLIEIMCSEYGNYFYRDWSTN